MLGDYYYLITTRGQHVVQTVLYLGREPIRLKSVHQRPSLDFGFEIISLRDYDAEPLLAGEDWADVAVARLREMESEERPWAWGTLLMLSGVLGIEETVKERIKEAGVID